MPFLTVKLHSFYECTVLYLSLLIWRHTHGYSQGGYSSSSEWDGAEGHELAGAGWNFVQPFGDRFCTDITPTETDHSGRLPKTGKRCTSFCTDTALVLFPQVSPPSWQWKAISSALSALLTPLSPWESSISQTATSTVFSGQNPSSLNSCYRLWTPTDKMSLSKAWMP